MTRFSRMVRNWFGKRRIERELDAELRFHLDARVEELRAQGVAPAEARRRAQLELGGAEQVKENVREVRVGATLESIWQDVRYGARMLRRNPGFTTVAVLTLALGIGANTAIFSVVHAVLLEPLPYPDSDRLVMIWNTYGGNHSHNSPPDYFDRVEQSEMLESIAAYAPRTFNLTGQGEPLRLQGAGVTASFFTTLGVAPLHGRVFDAEEDSAERGDVVVLSHGAWLRQFGGDAAAVGSKIVLNDHSFTIAGVMPPRFALLFPEIDIWAPMAFAADARADSNRGNEYILVFGRMKPGVSLQQAGDEMKVIAASVLERVPARRDFLARANWSADIVPLREQHAGDIRPVVLVLFGAVFLVLLIACLNVANLLLARGTGRVRELTVRAALGAGRARLVRQLLVESLVLALTGGALGLLLAWWGVQLLVTAGAGLSPLVARAELNAAAMAFAAGLMLLTGLLFGAAPALRLSRLDIQEGLKDGSRAGSAASRTVTRKVLVVSEVALALVLLVAAGLLLRSFDRLWDVHPGYDPASRLTFRVALPASRYAEPAQRLAFAEQLLERIQRLPGVLAVGNVQSLPISGTRDTSTVHVEGYELPPGAANLSAEYRMISPDYLRAMGIPVLRGRNFRDTDHLAAPRVLLVDEKAAQRFWPGEDAVGKRMGFGPGQWREVVGVVGSVRNRGLDDPGMEQVYIPYLQSPTYSAYYVIHAQGDAAALVPSLRAELRGVDANLPLFDIRLMEERLAGSMAQRQLSTVLLAAFAGVALTLAAIGIYGVLAYAVRQRTREIGIRMALGAGRGQILRLVIGQGMTLALAGLALGVLGAAAATRLLERLLFGVTPHDPATFIAVAVLLAAVALLACWIPARRATRVDPMTALRYE